MTKNLKLLLFLALLLWQGLNFLGFCYAKQRLYSYRELINTAIWYEINVTEATGRLPVPAYDAQAVGEFIQRHSEDCCSLYMWDTAWHTTATNILFTLTSCRTATVYINYNPTNYTRTSTIIEVDMCGDVKHRNSINE